MTQCMHCDRTIVNEGGYWIEDPGVYVVCEVIDPDDMGGDPVGWVLLKRREVTA